MGSSPAKPVTTVTKPLKMYKFHRVPTMSDDHKAWMTWAEKQFTRIAGNDRLIDKEEFASAFNVKKVSL